MSQNKSLNPINFEKDLNHEQLLELDIYTQIARNRLMEREISIAELKRKFLVGEQMDMPPLLISDFPNRLIGETLCDYHTNTVTHYKAYCAALARFGEDIGMTYTFTWEYKFVEFLGGRVSYIPDKAPITEIHPFKSEKDLETAPGVDIDSLIAEDLALKGFADKKLGDLLGPGTFISKDPFSQVASLLHNPQNLFMNMIDKPQFIHALCIYMYEIEREIFKQVVKMGHNIFFLPGYTLMLSPEQFNKFALPYVEKLLADFPETSMMIGSAGNATHLIEPLMKSSIQLPFFDGPSDLDIIVEKSKQYKKPFTILFPRTVLMKGDRNEIESTTKRLLMTAKNSPFYYSTDAILGGDVPNKSIDLFVEAYHEYAHYPFEMYANRKVDEEQPQIDKEEIKPEDVTWDESGEKALKTVPLVFRKTAKSEMEKLVAARGIKVITEKVFLEIKKQMGY